MYAQPVAEEDGELIECGLTSIGVCLGDLAIVLDGQLDQLGCGLVVRERAAGFDDLSDRHVQALDRIRGVVILLRPHRVPKWAPGIAGTGIGAVGSRATQVRKTRDQARSC